MTRPLRIEFPDAVYHVTSRGDRQEPIFGSDADRQLLLRIVDQALARLDAQAFAFCLMGNHYHFVLQTRQPNLSRLMRHINGQYTQAYNRRHGLTGHLFQGRFHAVLVDSDAYLIEVCRYVELNPVRAGLANKAIDWHWSSYRAHTGAELGYAWLATRRLHGQLLGHDAASVEDQRRAARLYAATVEDGLGVDPWAGNLRQEVFLGDDDFVAEMQSRATNQRMKCTDISKYQRTDPRTLARWMTANRSRQESFKLAYTQGGMTMGEIARQAGLSLSSISRIISAAEKLQDSRPDPARFKT
jgi:putative transposase